MAQNTPINFGQHWLSYQHWINELKFWPKKFKWHKLLAEITVVRSYTNYVKDIYSRKKSNIGDFLDGSLLRFFFVVCVFPFDCCFAFNLFHSGRICGSMFCVFLYCLLLLFLYWWHNSIVRYLSKIDRLEFVFFAIGMMYFVKNRG